MTPTVCQHRDCLNDATHIFHYQNCQTMYSEVHTECCHAHAVLWQSRLTATPAMQATYSTRITRI